MYFSFKPIAKDGHIKLSDFGLAKQLDKINPLLAKTFCGSPAYLSPEMLFKKGASKPLDIYGIGTIWYELLTGFPPHYDEELKKMYKNIAYGKLRMPRYISIPGQIILKVMNLIRIRKYLKKNQASE